MHLHAMLNDVLVFCLRRLSTQLFFASCIMHRPVFGTKANPGSGVTLYIVPTSYPPGVRCFGQLMLQS